MIGERQSRGVRCHPIVILSDAAVFPAAWRPADSADLPCASAATLTLQKPGLISGLLSICRLCHLTSYDFAHAGLRTTTVLTLASAGG